jgi:hypothetical protein
MGPLGVLRQRPLPFGAARTGELFGWSRIRVDEEAPCVVNPNGIAARGADVMLHVQLNPPGSTLTVIMNSAQAGGPPAPLILSVAR